MLFAAYHASGYVPRDTYVWAQGRPEWQPLHSVPELAIASTGTAAALAAADGPSTAVRQTENAVDSASDAAAQQAATLRPARDGGAAASAAPPAIVAAPAARHDPMAAFTAEISAIEAVSYSFTLNMLLSTYRLCRASP